MRGLVAIALVCLIICELGSQLTLIIIHCVFLKSDEDLTVDFLSQRDGGVIATIGICT